MKRAGPRVARPGRRAAALAYRRVARVAGGCAVERMPRNPRAAAASIPFVFHAMEVDTMNLFKRNRGMANAPAGPETTLGTRDVVPADGTLGNRLRAGSNAALNRASDVYRRHPKMVGGLAVLAGALLLNRMKAR
jgi:hypothetical protein